MGTIRVLISVLKACIKFFKATDLKRKRKVMCTRVTNEKRHFDEGEPGNVKMSEIKKKKKSLSYF